MDDYDGSGELGNACDDDDDDIARFEKQCAERARAEGLPQLDDGPEEEAYSDEEPESLKMPSAASGTAAGGSSGWQQKCAQLEEKLKRQKAELTQVRSDLSMVKSEGASTGDPTVELKQRLLHLTKYNRRLQVTAETQKSRIEKLEGEVRKPREQAKKQAEELALQNNSAYLGDGMEDWKQKYLYTSNKLQDARHEMQEVRAQFQKHRKALLKELGSDEALERALSSVDDPNAAQWKGRAAQITQLQRQVKELKKSAGPAGDDALEGADAETTPSRGRRARAEAAAEKDRSLAAPQLLQAADKRREEFERLQEAAEKLRSEQAESKRKREAQKARIGLLEVQLRDLKGNVQTLVEKSENDDELVSAMRRQLGRSGPAAEAGGDSGAMDSLMRDKAELQAQLERQSQIVQQLRSRNIASAVDSGSARLGGSAPSTPPGPLLDRVRYLEAENTRQTEHIKLLRGSGSSGSKPGSADAASGMREQLEQLSEQLANEQENSQRLRLALQRSTGGSRDPSESEDDH